MFSYFFVQRIRTILCKYCISPLGKDMDVHNSNQDQTEPVHDLRWTKID